MPALAASNIDPASAPNWDEIRKRRDASVEKMFEKFASVRAPVVFGNYLLVAVFIRPNVTAGGVHLTDRALKEDEYQGKTGIVLAKGPLVFVDDERTKFHGQSVEVGDWVVFRPNDTWSTGFNGIACRMLEDTQIKMVVSDPELVW